MDAGGKYTQGQFSDQQPAAARDEYITHTRSWWDRETVGVRMCVV